VRGLETLIGPEGDYVWRDGRYEYVRRAVPAIGALSGLPWWRNPEYQHIAVLPNGAEAAAVARANCWNLSDLMRAKR